MIPNLMNSFNQEMAKRLGLVGYDNSGRFLIITGSNSCGKSLLRRHMCLELHKSGVEPINLSLQARCREGFQRLMIYGSESDSSTGMNTARTFKTGWQTVEARNNPCALIWDEPELGMGEELQYGTALWLKEKMNIYPKCLLGVVIFTHSRIFVEVFKDVEGLNFFNFDGHRTADDWLSRKIVAEDMIASLSKSVQLWREIEIFKESSKVKKNDGLKGCL